MESKLLYDSPTNKRLRNPSHAQSIAEHAIERVGSTLIMATTAASSRQKKHHRHQFRVVLGFGPGRSGTKSLSELLLSQRDVIHCEHEMIVPRVYHRTPSGRIDHSINTTGEGKKGSWGSDKRLEWDTPPLARGEPRRTEEEEALWRMLRLLEQWKVFEGCVRDYYADSDADVVRTKPLKLGGKGWRGHNSKHRSEYEMTHQYTTTRRRDRATDSEQSYNKTHPIPIPVVASVSSVGLAYVHEYIALHPTVKIVILLRPCNEVVSSFMTKSKGRNHWQKHQNKSESGWGHVDKSIVQRDKTWDGAFPNMSDAECRLVMKDDNTATSEDKKQHRPDKSWAIRAYCKLYDDVARELADRYPECVRIYDMHSALNEMLVQENLLNWCGFDGVGLDTGVHLNKKK